MVKSSLTATKCLNNPSQGETLVLIQFGTVSKLLVMLHLLDICCNTLPHQGWQELGQDTLVPHTLRCYSQLVLTRLSSKLKETSGDEVSKPGIFLPPQHTFFAFLATFSHGLEIVFVAVATSVIELLAFPSIRIIVVSRHLRPAVSFFSW